MIQNILIAAGGIGLFLLGMLVLTDGLRGLAGNALRRILAGMTTSPASGAVAGAVTTAIIQSSSATTVTAVGFVGAGLLTFPQALGVIFGANIGTTVTGWLVAIVGFKLKLNTLVLPLILAGVLIRLFGSGWVRHLGMALAGFSLLFIGLDALQHGIATFEGEVTPDTFPPDTVWGRLQLVGIGIAITLVTQSSSAGVATAMVALGTGAISFPQAAAMVIGMDVGTTVTAALATVGGSTAMRQTGFAHVIYNLMTGVMAFALLTPWFALASPLLAAGGAGTTQIALVAFHSSFNILGVILVLPFTGRFAKLIATMIPAAGAPLIEALDDRLLADRRAATDGAATALRQIASRLFNVLATGLNPKSLEGIPPSGLDRVTEALEPIHEFIDRIHVDAHDKALRDRRTATVHVLDHIMRLHHRCRQEERMRTLRSDPRLRRLSGVLRNVVHGVSGLENLALIEGRLERLTALLHRQYHIYRDRTAALMEAGGEPDILDRLDSARWLYRSAYHTWRIAVHLRRAEQAALAPAATAPPPQTMDPQQLSGAG
tara:strand:- start:13263 stop:14900 length:1638 start_codon:yes stop_codon:yes gene_type:complete